MTKHIFFFVVFLLIISTLPAAEKASEKVPDNKIALWNYLKPGPFLVGFKVIQKYDDSRTIKPRYDYNGNYNDENTRPIQICIWYPAEPVKNASQPPNYLKYQEYLFLNQSEMTFTSPTEKEEKQLLASIKELAVRYGADPSKAIKVYSEDTIAIKNADPAKGTFPLILYAPGNNESAYSSAVLCEFLASHGYIAASASSFGMSRTKADRGMKLNLSGMESQARDLEFIMAEMKKFPNVDKMNTGTIGYSWGGISNVLASLRNHNINAVISMSGAIVDSEAMKIAEKYDYFRPEKMNVPFMLIIPKEPKEIKQDLSFFNKMKYADAWLLRFNRLIHGSLVDSHILQFFQYYQIESIKRMFGNEMKIEDLFRDYSTLCSYTLNFLDAYLKHKENAKEYLKNEPEKNGVSKIAISGKYKKGIPIPPTENEIIAMAHHENGVREIIKIFHEVKKRDPKAVLFKERIINALSQFFFKKGKVDNAVKLLELAVIQYPKSWNSYYNLAVALEKLGKKDDALKNYQKVLELIPQATNHQKELYKKVSQKINFKPEKKGNKNNK